MCCPLKRTNSGFPTYIHLATWRRWCTSRCFKNSYSAHCLIQMVLPTVLLSWAIAFTCLIKTKSSKWKDADLHLSECSRLFRVLGNATVSQDPSQITYCTQPVGFQQFFLPFQNTFSFTWITVLWWTLCLITLLIKALVSLLIICNVLNLIHPQRPQIMPWNMGVDTLNCPCKVFAFSFCRFEVDALEAEIHELNRRGQSQRKIPVLNNRH